MSDPKLRSVIVGRAARSSFPSEPEYMIRATMPVEHHEHFHSPSDPPNPFPADLLARADAELDNLTEVLKSHDVRVLPTSSCGFPSGGMVHGGYATRRTHDSWRQSD